MATFHEGNEWSCAEYLGDRVSTLGVRKQGWLLPSSCRDPSPPFSPWDSRAEPLSIQMGTVMILVMQTVFSHRLPEVPPPHPSGHLPAPAYSCLQALRQENSGSPFRVHPKYSL